MDPPEAVLVINPMIKVPIRTFMKIGTFMYHATAANSLNEIGRGNLLLLYLCNQGLSPSIQEVRLICGLMST